tara:strand:+ start:772 stop:1833 length:1062 start_codon:yes stop_codon:yes gene_type:complete
LGQEDRLVLLGDAIDRGPNSAGAVAFIRDDPRLLTLLGNHERMATKCLQNDGTIELWPPWMQRGGAATWGSYIVQAEGDLHVAKQSFADDLLWMDVLPTEIVLDDVRLVHAGYDPTKPLDAQTEHELLWIRRRFYRHDAPLDARRTVIFGHSTTTKFGSRPGDVAFSDVRLPDGRPSWLAMDIGAYNHVDPGLAAVDLRSMRIQRQQTLRSERWFDAPDQKEAPVSDFFGLRALESRRDRRVRPRSIGYARVAGVVLPRDGSCRSWAESQAAIASNELTPTTWRRLRAAASPPPPPPLSQRQAAQRHRILLGPGRPPERTHPVLPPPERFRIVRRKDAIKSASETKSTPMMRA